VDTIRKVYFDRREVEGIGKAVDHATRLERYEEMRNRRKRFQFKYEEGFEDRSSRSSLVLLL